MGPILHVRERRLRFSVLLVLLTMFVILAVAGLVAVYVIYPRRGLPVPRAPWLGDALDRAVLALPTLDNRPAEEARRVVR